MTRAKETLPGSGQLPDYKSPPHKLVTSLRKAYDNARNRIAKKSNQLNELRGNNRDITASREKWKKEAWEKNKEVEKLRKELEQSKSQIKKLEKKTFL